MSQYTARLFWATSHLALLAIGVGVSPVHADEPSATAVHADSIYTLPPVEVEERHPGFRESHETSSGAVTVRRIDEEPSRLVTTTELLSTMPGVHVRRFGGFGAYAGVSIRGSNPSQVSFYLDGVPLNRAQYGVTNAADLPLAAIDRVEVYRGTAPLRLGDAGGGVVHLVTRPIEGKQAQARLTVGDYDSQRAEAWGTWAGRRAGVLASYQYQGSRGAFSFLDDNATPFNFEDDRMTDRLNNAFYQHNVTTKVDVALGSLPRGSTSARKGGAGRLQLALDYFAKDTGLPGVAAFQSEEAHFDTRRGVASATWESPSWIDRTLDLRTQLYGVANDDHYRDLDGDLGRGRIETRDETRNIGGRQEIRLSPRVWNTSVGFVGEAGREEFSTRQLQRDETDAPVNRRDHVALGGEVRVEPLRDRVALFADVREQRAFDSFPAGRPFAGAFPRPATERTTETTRVHGGLLLGLPAGLTVRANASRAARIPTMFELYGNRGTVMGNPDLVPERLDTQDVGVGWSGAPARDVRVRLDVSAYRTDAQDLILFIQNSQNTAVARNVSAALLQGVESSVSAQFRWLRVQANWTAQHTEDRSEAPHWNGNQLPGRPTHELFTRSELRPGRWLVFHEFQAMSQNYLDRANLQPVASRQLHHVGAGLFVLQGRLGLTGEIRNVTNNVVRDVDAYPLPGRMVAFTLEGRL